MSHESAAAVEFLASRVSKFRPWKAPDTGRSPQAEFLAAAGGFRYRILRAGNRCGKSEVGAVDVILAAQGWHRFMRRKPPLQIWVCGINWDTIGQVIWPKFKKYLNLDRVSMGWQKRTGIEIPESIHFRNGSTITFKSAEAAREKFQGADLDLVWIDEEIDGTIVEEIKARLLDRGGYLNVTLTPVTKKAWVAQLERETSEGLPLTKVVRASMRDAAAAGIIDKKAVDAYLAGLPERQRRVREFGDYAALEGLVYPDYSEHSHVVRPRGGQLWTGDGKNIVRWPLPREWPRYGGIDFGFAVPTAVPILCEDPNTGRFYGERCYYASNVRISRWGAILRDELPPLEMPLVADHQAFERQELSGCGVVTTTAKKDIWPGLEAVERIMMPLPDGVPKLVLVVDDVSPPTHPIVGRYDSHWLSWELAAYRYKEKDPKDKHVNAGRDLPVKKNDHACDALRYVVTALERRFGCAAPIVPPTPDPHSQFRELLGASPDISKMGFA